jgi:hypothetical protein
MLIFCPMRRLRSVDLPTLGRPTRAIKPQRKFFDNTELARIFQLFKHSTGSLLFGLTATPGAALCG